MLTVHFTAFLQMVVNKGLQTRTTPVPPQAKHVAYAHKNSIILFVDPNWEA